MSDCIPTLADVCSAIAEGHLTASSDGSTYQVNALELRRYFSSCASLSNRSSLPALPAFYTNALDNSCSDLCHSGQ